MEEQLSRLNPKLPGEGLLRLQIQTRLQAAKQELAELKGHVIDGKERLEIPDYTPQIKTVRPPPMEPTPPTATEPTDEITFEDFLRVKMKVGTIVSAERVPKSDKLLKLTVSFGDNERTVVAGIGKSFTPEQVTGQQAAFVVNLKPRKMMGIESHGMILAVGDSPEDLALVQPNKVRHAGGKIG